MSGRNNKKETKRVSKAQRAGIVFPPTRFATKAREQTGAERMSAGVGVYLAAVTEYLTAEVLDIAASVARTNKRKRIIPRDIQLGVLNDLELNSLLGKATIAQGGVLPNVLQVLLPTKSKNAKPQVDDSALPTLGATVALSESVAAPPVVEVPSVGAETSQVAPAPEVQISNEQDSGAEEDVKEDAVQVDIPVSEPVPTAEAEEETGFTVQPEAEEAEDETGSAVQPEEETVHVEVPLANADRAPVVEASVAAPEEEEDEEPNTVEIPEDELE